MNSELDESYTKFHHRVKFLEAKNEGGLNGMTVEKQELTELYRDGVLGRGERVPEFIATATAAAFA